MSLAARALAGAVVAAACALPMVMPTGGCIAACPTVDRYYERGETLVAPNGAGVYETSPADGPYLPFEGGTVWHIQHGLGRAPTSVLVWTSFSKEPTKDLAGGFSGTAGNEAIVLQANDRDVVVKNDTCSGMYVRVRVEADVPVDAGSEAASDAGSDAASDAGADTTDATATD